MALVSPAQPTTASTNSRATPALRCAGDTHIDTSSIDDPTRSGRYPPTIPTADRSTMAKYAELRGPAAPSEAREAQWSSGWSTSAAWVEPNADGDSKSAARRIVFRTGPSSARIRRTVTSTLVSLADTTLERVVTLTAPTTGTSAHRLPPVWLRSRRRSRRLWPLPSRRSVPAPTVRSSTGWCGRSLCRAVARPTRSGPQWCVRR